MFHRLPHRDARRGATTLSFIDDRRDRVAVYIVGTFGLTHGSLVAQSPERFGIRETWELSGDDLGLGIFFAPVTPWKTDEERASVDDALADLSSGWTLRSYPWAGAVSTAIALALAAYGLTVLFERHVERRIDAELTVYNIIHVC